MKKSLADKSLSREVTAGNSYDEDFSSKLGEKGWIGMTQKVWRSWKIIF